MRVRVFSCASLWTLVGNSDTHTHTNTYKHCLGTAIAVYTCARVCVETRWFILSVVCVGTYISFCSWFFNVGKIISLLFIFQLVLYFMNYWIKPRWVRIVKNWIIAILIRFFNIVFLFFPSCYCCCWCFRCSGVSFSIGNNGNEWHCMEYYSHSQGCYDEYSSQPPWTRVIDMVITIWRQNW